MKKMLLLVVMSAAFMMAKAQIIRLNVYNYTSCPVYFVINFSVTSSTPTCAGLGTSSLLMIPPGGYSLYSGSATPASPIYVPGVPAPYSSYLLSAKILDGPTACASTAIEVGEGSCGFIPVDVINVRDASCIGCGTIKATWTTNSPGGDAILTFNQ